MKIYVQYLGRTKALTELVVEGDEYTIQDKIVGYNPQTKEYKVPDSLIEELIATARELSHFNGESYVEFVEKIAEAFLSFEEARELVEYLENRELFGDE